MVANDIRSCKVVSTKEESSDPVEYENLGISSYAVDSVYDVKKIENHKYHVSSFDEYKALYSHSIKNPEEFWDNIARTAISWISPYTRVFEGSFADRNWTWFLNGKLNACYNCVDRWAESKPESLAIIYEGDNPQECRKITFRELKLQVCRVANVLKSVGVKKGDVVTLYMPNVPELCFSVLACARIGAVHSVVFGGFSGTSLAERITHAKSKVVVTADGGFRATKHIKTKDIMDAALESCPFVTHCLVFKSIDSEINMMPGRDLWMHEVMASVRPYCPVEVMDSEDLLFVLYTSGSTGKPKGLAHTTGGYLVYTHTTTKYIFDVHEGDVFGCMADIGWITGHTYVIYGPLLNGITTFMFGSLPGYPSPDRYWRMCDTHKITQFYTAPTALRSLMGVPDTDAILSRYPLNSVRVLASVGEPINPEAWKWYHDVVGAGKIPVVDTFWQTETGGIVIAPLPGAIKTKPGSATLPFFGIDLALVDPHTGVEVHSNDSCGLLCIKKPWPGMFRTVYGDHARVATTYFPKLSDSESLKYYLSGDAAYRDKDGYIWISGRIDDTLNVSGHRLCSAEIEHALVQVDVVAEAAVVGYPHPIKGQGIFCFVTLKQQTESSQFDEIKNKLKLSIRQLVGPFATPDKILLTPHLPKTRSGKIMRRILRKLASKQFDEIGDTSTLANPEVVKELEEKVRIVV